MATIDRDCKAADYTIINVVLTLNLQEFSFLSAMIACVRFVVANNW